MALKIAQKNEIRNVNYGWIYSTTDQEKKLLRKTISENNPNYDVGQMRQMAFRRIEEKGYKIYKERPQAANCIIRVYKDEKIYEGTIYRLLGVNCFTKGQDGKWYTVGTNGEDFLIDFAEHKIRVWFFQDEYWDVSVDFFDTFVKIVKEN